MLAHELGPNWVRIPEAKYIRKLKLNHKVGDFGHIHIQVQSHWMKNLPICQRIGIGQVQDVMVNQNLGVQNNINLGADQ